MKRWMIGLGWMLALPAQAADLPVFDIRPACQARTATAVELAGCLQSEQDLRLSLSTWWNSVPDFRQHHCEQVIAFQRPERRSYADLISCVDTKISS